MHPNEALLNKFYTSFQQRDADSMTACYHSEIVFSDPIFQTLKGERAIAMWHMLIGSSKDMQVTFSDIRADDQQGTVHWEATYTYGPAHRQMHNIVNAQFRFQDGKILVHQDTFDLTRWAAQALGIPGRLFGWTPFIQQTIRSKAAQALESYIAKSK
jgi:limonene-1,2-epoxide hydrolase